MGVCVVCVVCVCVGGTLTMAVPEKAAREAVGDGVGAVFGMQLPPILENPEGQSHPTPVISELAQPLQPKPAGFGSGSA